MNNLWGPRNVELLEECIKAGMSALETSKKIGGVSRNACIGKALRLGWKFRSDDGTATAKARSKATPPRSVGAPVLLKFKAPVVKPSTGNPGSAASKAATAARKQIGIAGNGMTYETAPAVTLPKLRVIDATGEPARIIDPGYRGCKWPIDDPGAGRMDETRFCCGPREVNKPYCAQHLALAWTGLPKPSRAVKQPSVGPARGPGGHRYAFGGGVQ